MDFQKDSDDHQFGGSQSIYFLIHLTPTLDSLQDIFIVIFDLLCHLLKTSPNSSIGIKLINSKTQNELIPLQPLNVEMFKELSKFLENIDLQMDSPINIENNFGPQLLSSLELIHEKIKDVNSFYNKIFLITDCSKPFNGNSNLLTLLQNRLKNLANDKITLYPIILDNILNSNDSNNILNEYKSWFDTNLEFKPNLNKIKSEDFKSKLFKSIESKRFAFDLPLEIGKLSISIKGINILNPTELKSIKYYTDPQDGYNYPIISESIFLNENNEEISKDSLIKSTTIQNGHQHLPIFDEFDKIKKFNPKLIVKGTLPISKFNPFICSIGKFIIPNEKGEFTNSTLHFTSLLNSLTKKKLMILCWGSLTTNSIPSLYYLIPTQLFKPKSYPSVLALIKIPNGDEIRQPPLYLSEINQIPANPDLFKPLTDLMNLKSMEIIPNSILDWKLKTMIQIATNKIFDCNYMGDKMKFMIDAQRDQLNDKSQILNIISAYNSIENDLSFEDQKQSSKKLKREQLNDGNVKLFIKSNILTTYTVPELKLFIKSKDGAIKLANKKDDLIQNIINFYSSS